MGYEGALIETPVASEPHLISSGEQVTPPTFSLAFQKQFFFLLKVGLRICRLDGRIRTHTVQRCESIVLNLTRSLFAKLTFPGYLYRGAEEKYLISSRIIIIPVITYCLAIPLVWELVLAYPFMKAFFLSKLTKNCGVFWKCHVPFSSVNSAFSHGLKCDGLNVRWHLFNFQVSVELSRQFAKMNADIWLSRSDPLPLSLPQATRVLSQQRKRLENLENFPRSSSFIELFSACQHVFST